MKIFESEFDNSMHRSYLLSDTVYQPFTYWVSDYLYERVKKITLGSGLPICTDIISTDKQHQQIALSLDISENVLNICSMDKIRSIFENIDDFVRKESMFIQNHFRLIELLEPGDKKEFERTVTELKHSQSYSTNSNFDACNPN